MAVGPTEGDCSGRAASGSLWRTYSPIRWGILLLLGGLSALDLVDRPLIALVNSPFSTHLVCLRQPIMCFEHASVGLTHAMQVEHASVPDMLRLAVYLPAEMRRR